MASKTAKRLAKSRASIAANPSKRSDLKALIAELRNAEIARLVERFPGWEPDQAWLDDFGVRGMMQMLQMAGNR